MKHDHPDTHTDLQSPSGSLVEPDADVFDAGKGRAAVSLCAVTHEYGDRSVLVDLDFTLERGRSIAIMGPSGSGKSTLLNVLAGMVRPQAGSVSLFGATWADGTAAMRSMRGKFIGVVPQRAELLNELTVVENVALPLLLDGVDFSSAVAAAKPIMSRLGILSIAKGGPSTISAGEAQRTAIARALIRNPTLVIADEPTSALDADNAGIVAQILSAGDEGRACIMMTHDEVVARHCDASMQLKDGSLHLMART